MNDLYALIRKCSEYKYVYIYGDGEVGRLIRVYLHEQEFEISGFLTTYKPKKKIIMDVPVCKLESLKSASADTFIIICMVE